MKTKLPTFASVLLVSAALACTSAQPACTKQQGTEVATVGVDTGLCILQHLGEPAPQIAKECLGAEAACLEKPDSCPQVSQVLAFEDGFKAAMVREAVTPGAGGK